MSSGVVGFKKLFGSEPNKILLIDFLNQILPDKHQIQDLIYSRNKQLGLNEVDRKAIFERPKFKKQEAELETQFDKWLFVFRHLSNLQNRPQKLQDKIFQMLFEAAEIAKLSSEEREAYEESLKYYRDLKNVVDTSRIEGIKEVAKKMKEKGMSDLDISELTGLNDDEIRKL